ncbi:MAG: hypothetical protein PHW73_10885 [Atribacterota bacterium]|nr:hypothetical protein [Atribacterota bacterium]
MRLGTYSTIDCPTNHIDEAQEWLESEFEKIGGTVRKVMNPHDMGSYPSFEIDYPSEVELADEYVNLHGDDEIDGETQEEFDKQQEIFDNWTEKANEIEAEYNKKFNEWL